MRLVALTGGVACGKSTVAKYLYDKYHFHVIDSDALAFKLQLPHTPVWNQIVAHFGRSILNPDDTLNRKQLGALVFKDHAQRRVLNHIVHPAVLRQLLLSVVKFWLTREQVVVLEIPLFFEVRIPAKYFHDIVCVAVTKEEQIRRLVDRNQLTPEAAENRIAAQMPTEEKCKRSSVVIWNNGDEKELRSKLDDLVVRWNKRTCFTYLPDPLLIAVSIILLVVLAVWFFR
jgi:dephospho-CoA kinase